MVTAKWRKVGCSFDRFAIENEAACACKNRNFKQIATLFAPK
jgi:hypothetical protein